LREYNRKTRTNQSLNTNLKSRSTAPPQSQQPRSTAPPQSQQPRSTAPPQSQQPQSSQQSRSQQSQSQQSRSHKNNILKSSKRQDAIYKKNIINNAFDSVNHSSDKVKQF